MRFSKFEFKNFRGISEAVLDLSRTQKEAVNVLVGLNESGKTTVLEAINHFRSNPDLKRKDPNQNPRVQSDYQAMLPIGERALFNGVVSIKSTLSFEPQDIAEFDKFLKSEFQFVESKYAKSFYIDFRVTFEDSQLKKLNNSWGLQFHGRKRKGQTPFKKLEGEAWMKAVGFLEKLLPKVMYFPASLLEFPDRIQLENPSSSKNTPATPNKASFYYQVIADVLHAIDPKLDLEKHVLERARSRVDADTQNLEALVQKVEVHLNQTVLGEWQRTLGATLGGKRFKFYIKKDDSGCVYAEIKLLDGNNLFSLNERSAGFRWFFAFIMLVKYRVHRNDRVLFLFDEPAANLHPRAQALLLNSFALLSESHQFVFSTHSHYLVNPLWLESTFIVKNDATEEANFDTDPATSNISITPYRTFVGSHAEQYFYYKPVMDALEYTPAKISPETASILIEGKTDFYCLEYFKRVYFKDQFEVTFFPGGGSGTLDPLISLLSGWAVNFLVLLDGDESGIKEKARYENKFESLVSGRIKTISEILKTAKKSRIEEVFLPADLDLIRLNIFPQEKNLSKKLLHKAIQELLASNRKLPFSKETLSQFEQLLTGLEAEYQLFSLL
jgi:energy-coupling factor transporter ATP-binding protein EcfA2